MQLDKLTVVMLASITLALAMLFYNPVQQYFLLLQIKEIASNNQELTNKLVQLSIDNTNKILVLDSHREGLLEDLNNTAHRMVPLVEEVLSESRINNNTR